MDELILESIKKLLGIAEDFTNFDTDLLIHINSTISVLAQIGVSSTITSIDDNTTWGDYLGSATNLEMIKTYIYLKVKLLFDPPQTSFVLDSIKNQIAEYEWRINVTVDPS